MISRIPGTTLAPTVHVAEKKIGDTNPATCFSTERSLTQDHPLLKTSPCITIAMKSFML